MPALVLHVLRNTSFLLSPCKVSVWLNTTSTKRDGMEEIKSMYANTHAKREHAKREHDFLKTILVLFSFDRNGFDPPLNAECCGKISVFRKLGKILQPKSLSDYCLRVPCPGG